jgi:hypothetical protein
VSVPPAPPPFVVTFTFTVAAGFGDAPSGAPVTSARCMTVLSVVSPSKESLKPTTIQVCARPEIVTGWPTRKPCDFQSNGSERVTSTPWAVGVRMTEPISFVASSGSSVPRTRKRSLPWPSMRLTTSIELLPPSVWNWPSTNMIEPKLIPPGKIAGSPNVCGLPLEYVGPKSRSPGRFRPLIVVDVIVPKTSSWEPSLKMLSTSICFDSGGCAPIANSGPSFSPGSFTPRVSERSAPVTPPSTATGPRSFESLCSDTGKTFTPCRVSG